MTLSRSDALATAGRSTAAATARDRNTWVGLYASDGRVEDPVGSQPHRGRAAIGRFFDTFIGPRHVAYLPDVDIVSGSTVIRDGILQAALGPVTLQVPIYIRYDIQEVGDDPKIAGLSAFWELPVMVGQFLRGGFSGMPEGLKLTRLLLTNQGVVGTLGFLGGLRGAGPAGKRRFREFLADALAGDEVAVRRRLGKGARMTIGDEAPLGTTELLSRLAGTRPRKMIAAGYSLVVGLDRDGGRDVMIADVAAKPFAINRIRYFSDGA
jgi:hypothetical protein